MMADVCCNLFCEFVLKNGQFDPLTASESILRGFCRSNCRGTLTVTAKQWVKANVEITASGFSLGGIRGK